MTMTIFRKMGTLAMAACTLAVASRLDGGAAGSERSHDRGHADHDRVRQQFDRGRIKALPQVIEAVRPSIEGEIIEIEFEMEDGVPVYEFKYIDRGGRVRKLYVDARSAKILKSGDD